MRRAFTLALCSLLIAGCVTRGGKKTASGGDARPPSPAVDPNRTVPGPVQIIGHIIAIDPRSLSVIIEVSPFATLPAALDGQIFIARFDDLRPTARLQASPYLRGRTLGARLLAGQPQVGQEVVFAPPPL